MFRDDDGDDDDYDDVDSGICHRYPFSYNLSLDSRSKMKLGAVNQI